MHEKAQRAAAARSQSDRNGSITSPGGISENQERNSRRGRRVPLSTVRIFITSIVKHARNDDSEHAEPSHASASSSPRSGIRAETEKAPRPKVSLTAAMLSPYAARIASQIPARFLRVRMADAPRLKRSKRAE